MTLSAAQTVLFPRHKIVPINNVRAFFQTGREKSIANGVIIDKIAGDRNGMTSLLGCVKTPSLRQILHSYQFFSTFFLYNFDASNTCIDCERSAQSMHVFEASKLYKVEIKHYLPIVDSFLFLDNSIVESQKVIAKKNVQGLKIEEVKTWEEIHRLANV